MRALLAGGRQNALEAALAQTDLSPRDRSLFARLTAGTLKMRRALDWSLRAYLKRPLHELDPALQWVLRLGAYQLLYLEKIPAHSAVDESVTLARRGGHSGTAAVANAVLRKLAAAPLRPPEPRPDDPPSVLADRASLPDWLAEHLLDRFGYETALRIADGVNAMPRRALRVNTRILSVAAAAAALARAGVVTRSGRYGIADCLVLESAPAGSAVTINRLIGAGRLTMQSEESQLAVHLLDPKPGETVVDLCAGRGVKTGAIAQRDPGALFALDDDAGKLANLAQEMVRLQLDRVEVVRADATRALGVPLADAVLVDAPCSGIGTIGRRADLRWAKSLADPARLAYAQAAILHSAAGALRSGGRLLYVTCSTDAREDEDVVRGFAAAHPDVRPVPLAPHAPLGALQVRDDGAVLSIPGIDGADGFFFALFRKD